MAINTGSYVRPADFTGALNANEILASCYNMIISQQVFSKPIANMSMKLVNDARVDGSLYGDTKLFYSTDVLASYPWQGDAEAQKLLKLHRPASPKCQKIVLSEARQIALTLDNYLTKRAWSDEYAFSDFNSMMLSWMGKTKDIHDATLYNATLGNMASGETEQNITITLTDPNGLSGADLEAANRHNAQYIATKIGDILIDLEDITRKYNDYHFLRSYDPSELKFVWSAQKVNEITKYDLPTIFHKDGLIDKFGEDRLPERYFGTPIATAGTAPTPNTSVRSLIEKDYNTVEMADASYNPSLHVFPGDLIPAGQAYGEYEAYTEDNTVLLKIIHNDSMPFMSAFNVGTNFYNPRSLTETHYITWMYNPLTYIREFPMITVKGVKQ